jgi:hypothetical protein
VREVLLNLLADFELTLGLAGCSTCAEISPEFLVQQGGAGRPRRERTADGPAP